MAHAIALQLDNPVINLSKDDGSTLYVLNIELGEIIVDITLAAVSFETLVRQGQALIPSPNTTLTTAELETIRRQSSWPLKRLDDTGWRLLLREVSCNSLLTMLWYMKDVELAKTVMRNMSQRAAALLTEDLITKFQGRDPDLALAADAENGQQALAEILSVFQCLVDQGQLPELSS